MLVFKAMLTFCILSLAPLTAAIWPIPTHYEHGDRTLTISKHVTFTYTSGDGGQALQKHYYDQPVQNYYYDATEQIWFGPETSHQEPENSGERILNGNDLVQYAIRSAYNSLFNHNIVPWKFHPRNWTEHSLESVPYISHVDLKLLQNDPDEIVKSLAGDVDESYTLILTEIGNATISANTSVGLVRGLTTFTQLFFQHSRAGSSMYSDHGPSDISHPTTYTTLAPVSIADTPAFQHRGLNLDVSRHFFPVTDIKRTISALAYNKMNRLHLHVTDSQSWPLDIPALPSLAKQGAFRPDLIYTADDFDDLQRHAALQGVQLITEIDMPGHTSSIYHSNPELIAAFDIQPEHYTYAAEPPSGTLKLNSSVVYDFLETVLDDLLPRIAPYTSYFHTGGDEVNRNAYLLDDTVRSNDPAVLQPLMQTFIDRNHAQLRARGITPIVWEEMLLEWNLTLGKDVVVQSWRSDDAVKQIVEKGHKTLVGNYMYWYLDCGKGQWLNQDSNDPGQYQDYCAPYHNWRTIYSFSPLANIPLSKHHLVLGGEVHLWAEQTDPSNLDQMLWPRAAAAAEVLWSGSQDADGNGRSQKEAAPRLSEMRERLVSMGVRAEPVQMVYCTMEGGCGA